MENKNVVLLRHNRSNRVIKLTGPSYTNQVDDNLDDYIVVDVTSRVVRQKEFIKEHPTFVKEVSPFYVGPLVSSDGVKCNIFEILWQCGKVYPCHDDNGKPNEAFFKWRNEFYAKEKCSKDLMRHACKDLGYEHKDCRYFAYYNNDTKEWEALDYITAGKKVYIPEYAKLVYNTDAIKWLKSLVDGGKKVALVDFDAFNYYSDKAKKNYYKAYAKKCKDEGRQPAISKDDFMNISTMKDIINLPLATGHAFVIKAILDGSITVVNGKVIDNDGLLE